MSTKLDELLTERDKLSNEICQIVDEATDPWGIKVENVELKDIALTLVIVGALNWLLIGLLKFDLVAALFGTMSLLSRIVYSLVGLSGIISIGLYSKIND